MPYTTFDELKNAIGKQREIISVNIGANTVIAGRVYDLWRAVLPQGAVPSAPVVPNNDTLGCLGQRDAGAGLTNRIISARFNAQSPGNIIICDRLSHQGGLSGTVTTPQTTNLPTAAITRGSAEGVMLGLTIYTQIGATATTVSATYTNQNSVGSRVTPQVVFGGTGFREANRMILLPLQEGDTGVESVQSVTVTATTGTAGAFGVTLFRPILAICIDNMSGILSTAGIIVGNTCGGISAVPNGSCLFPIMIGASTTGAGSGALLIDEIS